MVLTALAGLVAAILLLPTISDCISAAVWVLRRRAPRAPPHAEPPPRLLFLVPAHDEALLLPSCLTSLGNVDYAAERMAIVVVADNCTDRTAAIARATGAMTLERTDLAHPGKPSALAWAFSRLPLDRFDAVVIVDADVVLDPGFARAIARHAPLADRVVQPYNDVRNPGDNALTRLAALYAAVLFRVAFRLKAAAGLTVPLSAGMCIGTGVLRRYPWDARSICEDWELYASYSCRGVSIALAADARIGAQEERTLQRSRTQRQRWFAGKLVVARMWVPRLAASRVISPRQALDAIAELVAPGPVVHGALALSLAVVALLVEPRPWAAWSAGLLIATLLRPLLYTALAVRSLERPVETLRAFLFLPRYAVWRVWVAARSLAHAGRREWVRTARHAPGSSA